jgi:leader peptidase (prepilin peptidase)/N-methyltransferase
MSTDGHDVIRIDVGDGLYVRVSSADPAGHEAEAPAPAPAPAAVWRVPPVALALGTALAVVALVRLGVTPHGILAAGLLPVLVVLAAIDLRVRILPNRIVLPALAVVLVWQIVFFPDQLMEWLLAGVGAAIFLLLPSLVRPGAFGMGDIKLAILLGAALGAQVLLALTVGFLVVVPVALFLVARGASLRGATVPFGPCLAFGAAVVLLG